MILPDLPGGDTALRKQCLYRNPAHHQTSLSRSKGADKGADIRVSDDKKSRM